MESNKANLTKKPKISVDSRLLSRIDQILQQHDMKAKRGSSTDWFADKLQEQYGEYRRKKRVAFRKSVEKAFDYMLDQQRSKNPKDDVGIEKPEEEGQKKRQKLSKDGLSREASGASNVDSDDEKSFSSDNEYVAYPDTNSMNSFLTNMYKKPSSQPSSRNPSAPPSRNPSAPSSPLRPQSDPSLEHELFVIDRQGQKPVMEKPRTSLPASPKTQSPVAKLKPSFFPNTSLTAGSPGAGLNRTEELTSTDSMPKVSTSTPFVLESKERRMASLALNREDGVNFEIEETSAVPKDSLNAPSVEIKQKGEKRKERESTPEPSAKTKTSQKRARREKVEKEEKAKVLNVCFPTVQCSDIGGLDEAQRQLARLSTPILHPELSQRHGYEPTRGILFHGPSGCGKTLLAHALAGELNLPLLTVKVTDIVSGVSGESEQNVNDAFSSAVTMAPCVLFFDQLDTIAPKRESASKDMERRIVTQLMTCMSDLPKDARVLMIGATSRPDSLDLDLRMEGRFEKEIPFTIPDEKARIKIIEVLCRVLPLAENFDMLTLARQTPGYVGSDLKALIKETGRSAADRIFGTVDENLKQKTPESAESASEPHQETLPAQNQVFYLPKRPTFSPEELATLCYSMEDFKEAMKVVKPSAMREDFTAVPNVTFDDIGALADVREELNYSITLPVQRPEMFAKHGLSNPTGILLAGPPGCGKTLLAKAIANEAGLNFISIKGPELLNMYVGESERGVRQLFQRARNSAPCVIFFDELDSLCPQRESGQNGASTRVVNQLLTEMDGLEERKQVFVLGATNRPDMIDSAILRPGRLDKQLYVGLPTPQERYDILNTITKGGTLPELGEDVDLKALAEDPRCEGFSGADLKHLVREASRACIKESINEPTSHSDLVSGKHFQAAFSKVKSSVSPEDQRRYQKMRERLGAL